LEHGQVHDVSFAEKKEDMNRKRLNICRKKQWHTFKVQDVKRKGGASLGLTTGVGSIYYVLLPSMGRRNVTRIHWGRQRQAAGVIVDRAKEGHDEELEKDQEVERDGTDPYNEVIFGRKRPDSDVFDWENKVIYVLEFKRTSRLLGEGGISSNGST
jgi:hypothetical protein